MLLAIFILAGCNTDSALTYAEVDIDHIDGEIQSFFQEVRADRVKVDKVPEVIRLFHNDEEASFGTISGN